MARYFVGFSLLLMAAGCAAPSESAPPIPWKHSLALSMEAASQSGKPILLYLNAEWCQVCRRVESESFANPEVVKSLEGFVPLKVDIDRQPWVARKYRVDAVPTYLLLDSRGFSRAHALGYKSRDEMTRMLARWLPAEAQPDE